MDYNPPVGMAPPKLCCFPARPLVCVLALLGIIRGVVMFIITPSWGEKFPHFIFVALNALLLFGAAKNNEAALKWSQRVVLMCVFLACLQFAIFPVLFSSLTASGLADNSTIAFEEDDLFGKEHTKKEMFIRGIVAGYAFELGCAVLIGAQILKYILVHRLWMYAKATENVGGNQYIVP